jgi:hypothetical protein
LEEVLAHGFSQAGTSPGYNDGFIFQGIIPEHTFSLHILDGL